MFSNIKQRLDDLVPPHENYRYFSPDRVGQLEPSEVEFSVPNACWMADAALLAYADEEQARQWSSQPFAQGQFQDVRYFVGKTTQAYVAVHAEFIVTAFRGTRLVKPQQQASAESQWELFLGSLQDMVIDAQLILRPEGAAQHVHHGFQQALNQIWEPLHAHWQTLRSRHPDRPFWMTGHSLGAALATLAASRNPPHTLYTYGSPRTGDVGFATAFSGLPTSAFRVINDRDPITQVPLAVMGYQHVGRLVRIVGSNPPQLEFRDSEPPPLTSLFDIRNFDWSALRSADPRSWFDHAPKNYADQLAAIQSRPT